MDLVLDLLSTVSRWSRSNLSEISLALVGCLLVLFGTDIKAWVEGRLGNLAGALRVPPRLFRSRFRRVRSDRSERRRWRPHRPVRREYRQRPPPRFRVTKD